MTSNIVRYVTQEGKLTIEGLKLFQDLERRLQSTEAKLAAIAAITAPSGGAVTDAQARAAINSILSAAG